MDYAHLDKPLELQLHRQRGDLDGLHRCGPNYVLDSESACDLVCEYEFDALNLYVNQ